jgi:hypothetical protein
MELVFFYGESFCDGIHILSAVPRLGSTFE